MATVAPTRSWHLLEELIQRCRQLAPLRHVGTRQRCLLMGALEPQMLKANSLELLNSVLGTDYGDSNELIEYMTKPANKTDVALKIFDTTEAIAFPGYIDVAVE